MLALTHFTYLFVYWILLLKLKYETAKNFLINRFFLGRQLVQIGVIATVRKNKSFL